MITGKLDILFSNAGIRGVTADLANYLEEVFDQVISVNLKGYFLGLKHAIPEMLQSGGSISILLPFSAWLGCPGWRAMPLLKGSNRPHQGCCPGVRKSGYPR